MGKSYTAGNISVKTMLQAPLLILAQLSGKDNPMTKDNPLSEVSIISILNSQNKRVFLSKTQAEVYILLRDDVSFDHLSGRKLKEQAIKITNYLTKKLAP